MFSTRAAVLAAVASTVFAMPDARADVPQPAFITMLKGETPSHARYASKVRAQAAALRAQWLAAHPASQPALLAAPMLQSGKVLSNTITIGSATAFPSIGFTFSTSTAGLASVQFVFVSPNGAATYPAEFVEPAYVTAATINFVYPIQLNLWSQPGNWTLQSASVMDNAGNSTSYDAAALAKLFPVNSFRVINNNAVDSTPPAILGGNIVSENISMAQRLPLLRASITGSDASSGFDLAYIYVQPPGLYYAIGQTDTSLLPLYHGSMPVNTNLRSVESYSGVPPSGAWTITGYELCDAASNCTQSRGASDVQNLFGTTTFNVTQ